MTHTKRFPHNVLRLKASPFNMCSDLAKLLPHLRTPVSHLEVTSMLLDTIFAPFVKERPICVMARVVLERLLDAPRIDDLFARTAQRQYTREIMFSSLVQLMSEVVLGVHPTVHAAYTANKEAIGVSTTALYNKLDRVEPEVSAALVHDSAALAEPVVKALRASYPRWIPGYQIKVLDGNHLSATEHRLKALRGT